MADVLEEGVHESWLFCSQSRDFSVLVNLRGWMSMVGSSTANRPITQRLVRWLLATGRFNEYRRAREHEAAKSAALRRL